MFTALFGILMASAGSGPAPVVTTPAARADDPPVRVWLNSDGDYYRGDRAKVRVRLEEDGYLLVLQSDVDGHVRVLFPLDPSDDDFVRGGRDFELRGRGDRETFYIDDVRGTGMVLAARSPTPFRYDRFVRGDHWDYRALANDRVRDDPQAGLLDLVDAMADLHRRRIDPSDTADAAEVMREIVEPGVGDVGSPQNDQQNRQERCGRHPPGRPPEHDEQDHDHRSHEKRREVLVLKIGAA